MSCAIDHNSMAHQWRNQSAPLLNCAYRKKLMAQRRPLAVFQRRTNGATALAAEVRRNLLLPRKELYR